MAPTKEGARLAAGCEQPTRRQLVLTGLLLALATLVLRGAQLGSPDTFVFDEIFYVNDAVDLVLHGAEQTWAGHPPLGKWLIGLPLFFGELSPFTWRLAPLVGGAIVVVLVLYGTVLLTRSLVAGTAASFFVLTDGITHFTGRYAVLDGFAALFTTATLVAVLATWQSEVRYRNAALIGTLAGAAIACKWSALPAAGIAAVLYGFKAWRASGAGKGASIGATVVGTVIVVYVATFSPWIVSGTTYPNCSAAPCFGTPAERLVRLPAMQRAMLRSTSAVDDASPLRTETWRWVLQDRSMRIAVPDCRQDPGDVCVPGSTHVRRVVVRGNRVLWPGGLMVLVASFVLRRRPDTTVPLQELGITAAWALVLAAPWVLAPKTYLTYAAPIVPALAIGAVAATWNVFRSRQTRSVALSVGLLIGAALFMTEVGAAPWAT